MIAKTVNGRAVVVIIQVNFRFDLEVNYFQSSETFGEVFLMGVSL